MTHPYKPAKTGAVHWRGRNRKDREPLIVPLYPIERIGAGTCVWPIGDPKHKGFRFCGEPVDAHGRYCPEHDAMGHPKRSD